MEGPTTARVLYHLCLTLFRNNLPQAKSPTFSGPFAWRFSASITGFLLTCQASQETPMGLRLNNVRFRLQDLNLSGFLMVGHPSSPAPIPSCNVHQLLISPPPHCFVKKNKTKQNLSARPSPPPLRHPPPPVSEMGSREDRTHLHLQSLVCVVFPGQFTTIRGLRRLTQEESRKTPCRSSKLH